MKVRVRVCQSSVAEGNCVAARRGGEQPEANDQSIGYEPDSAGCCGEPAGSRRSLKIDGHVELARTNDGHATQRVWGRNDRKAERSKRGYLSAEVTAGRSQSPNRTDVPIWATKGLPGGDARHSRAGGSTLPRVVLGGNERRGKQSRVEGSRVGRTRRSRLLAPSNNVTAARLACTREAGKISAGGRCQSAEKVCGRPW